MSARQPIAHYSGNVPAAVALVHRVLGVQHQGDPYVKGEKKALAGALSRHPDPSSQPLDHLVTPFNMDVVGFHGLSASVATAAQRGVHQLSAPKDLFGAGAVVQPVAPP